MMREWLDSGKHLPPFLRDFSKAGWLFRWIDTKVKKRRNDPQFAFLMNEVPNMVGAQIYVIDYFLWLMAMHGWTLQRSRKRMDFDNIEKVIDEYETTYRAAWYESLKLDMEKRQSTEEDNSK